MYEIYCRKLIFNNLPVCGNTSTRSQYCKVCCSNITFKRQLRPQSHFSLIKITLVKGKGTVSAWPAFCTSFIWKFLVNNQVGRDVAPHRFLQWRMWQTKWTFQTDITKVHPRFFERYNNKGLPNKQREILPCLEKNKLSFSFYSGIFWCL